jgi:hypothetical protein
MPSHSQSCRCSLHAEITTSRADCYRQLARAIVGPLHPQDDLAVVLAHELTEHDRFVGPVYTVVPIRRRHAA